MKKNNKKGFTIVELVVVIAVIGILAAVLIPTFTNITEKAERSGELQEATSALKIVLTDEDGQLDTENYTYYFISGKSMFKYADGGLVELNKTDKANVAGATVVSTDEIFVKAGNDWIATKGLVRNPYTVDEANDSFVYTVGVATYSEASLNGATVTKENVSKLTNRIEVTEIDLGDVIVWKDAK